MCRRRSYILMTHQSIVFQRTLGNILTARRRRASPPLRPAPSRRVWLSSTTWIGAVRYTAEEALIGSIVNKIMAGNFRGLNVGARSSTGQAVSWLSGQGIVRHAGLKVVAD